MELVDLLNNDFTRRGQVMCLEHVTQATLFSRKECQQAHRMVAHVAGGIMDCKSGKSQLLIGLPC